MFFICFVSRNGNKKKTRRRIKHKKRRMGALRHYSIACKLYTQIRDCLMRKTFRQPSVDNVIQLLLYFFMCCAKPVMQKSNIFAYGSVLFTCFCKSYTKTFCIFHRRTSISLRQFLNKETPAQQVFHQFCEMFQGTPLGDCFFNIMYNGLIF